jgi:hypothetical protein
MKILLFRNDMLECVSTYVACEIAVGRNPITSYIGVVVVPTEYTYTCPLQNIKLHNVEQIGLFVSST